MPAADMELASLNYVHNMLFAGLHNSAARQAGLKCSGVPAGGLWPARLQCSTSRGIKHCRPARHCTTQYVRKSVAVQADNHLANISRFASRQSATNAQHNLLSLQGHTGKVSCLALSPSGRLLASGQITYLGFTAGVQQRLCCLNWHQQPHCFDSRSMVCLRQRCCTISAICQLADSIWSARCAAPGTTQQCYGLPQRLCCCPADIIIWDLETRSLLHRLQLQKVGSGINLQHSSCSALSKAHAVRIAARSTAVSLRQI